MNAIITALIGGLCVAIPSIITTISKTKRNSELLNYRLNELTKMADKHEKLTERVKLNEAILKDLKEKIDNLYKKSF